MKNGMDNDNLLGISRAQKFLGAIYNSEPFIRHRLKGFPLADPSPRKKVGAGRTTLSLLT